MSNGINNSLFEGNHEAGSSLEIDMLNIASQTFETLPKGEYTGVITKCEYKVSKSSGQPMWSMRIEVDSGTHAGTGIFHNMSFSPKALPMTKGALVVICPELLTESFKPKEIADSDTLIGKQVRFRTKIESYEGQDQARIQNFLRATTLGAFGGF